MSRQTQDSMLLVGVIAGGVGVISFLALMALGGYAFSPAAFLAILLAAAVAVFLLVAFHRKPEPPVASGIEARAHAPRAAAPAPAPEPAPTPEPAPEPAPAPVAAAAPEPAPAPSPAPSGAAARPAALEGPRAGGADDLKKIKGVGPKLEAMLHRMGFFHYDQVANWTEAEVAWVDENLEGFKGRVSRDNWVEQARILAGGGETEFSKRVDGGDVY